MNTQNNKNVLNLLYHSVISEGGDGDAIWLSKYTSLDEIFELLKIYTYDNHINWKIERVDGYIIWGYDDESCSTQEGVIITDKEDLFKNQRSVLKLDY
jgi:hypothetical protein